MTSTKNSQRSAQIFVVRTAENTLRIGNSSRLPERLAQLLREDSKTQLVYTASKSDPDAKDYINKLKKFGILAGCPKNRYPMTLKLVSQLANPINGNRRASSSIFEQLLATEIEPGLTIEQACPVCLVVDPKPPTPQELTHRVLLLRSVGLYYEEYDPQEPGLLKLEDSEKFLEALPQLKHIVPFLVQSDGVWLRSGQPFKIQKPSKV